MKMTVEHQKEVASQMTAWMQENEVTATYLQEHRSWSPWRVYFKAVERELQIEIYTYLNDNNLETFFNKFIKEQLHA